MGKMNKSRILYSCIKTPVLVTLHAPQRIFFLGTHHYMEAILSHPDPIIPFPGILRYAAVN